MHFDDRLSTVLRKPVTGDAIARIQYRQLLDLLGTTPPDAQGESIDAAYLRLSELAGRIPADERAAMLQEPMVRLRNSRLIAHLAEAEPTVAAAAFGAARLDEEQWLDLIPALPIRARGIARHRRDLGPQVEALLSRLGIVDQALPHSGTPAPPAEPIEGIGEIVKRIEQFRKTRQQQESEAALGDAPRLPLEDADEESRRRLELFDFATDAEGRIVWSDPAAAAMSIGLRLAARDAESPAQSGQGLVAAFRRRQPIRGESLSIIGAPAIAGDWQADAAPRFDRPGGRFIGYCGRMRRRAEAAPPLAAPVQTQAESEADRMRQILHELRTPVNAIQGFAEVIQQQLFGPTPHEYRALAATIASDGAHMLAGFEEIDRLVKLDSGALELEDGDCDIAAVLAATTAQIEPYLVRRGSGLVAETPQGKVPVAMAAIEAERLVWRLLATLAGAAAPGEMVRIKLRPARDGMVRITFRLPASLAEREDESLFHATAAAQQALSAGMFGTGFALRLATAEARAAGGSLERKDARLRLSLPGSAAIEASDAHSLSQGGNP